VKNRTLLSLLTLATGIIIMMTTSCKKGDTGPAGAAGPDSVFYSNWITLQMTPQQGDTSFAQTIQAPAITSAILDKGSVVGYILTGDAINNADSSIVDANFFANQTFSVGKVELLAYYQDLTGNLYRYVVIPGTIAVTDVSGTVQHYTADQLKKMGYQQVSQLLSIPAKGAGSMKLNSPN
jgi:hypothetical protein